MGKNHFQSCYPFVLSAESPIGLQSAASYYLRLLGAEPHEGERESYLGDLCYTSAMHQKQQKYNVSFSCTSIQDFKSNLEKFQQLPRGSHHLHWPTSSSTPKCIFVFSGQGASTPGMAKELMETCSQFSGIVLRCDAMLQSAGHPSVADYLKRASTTSSLALLNQTEEIIISQCACVVVEYALARILIDFGVEPSLVVGHSLGEYAALCIAESLKLQDMLHLVATRARLMVQYCALDTSSMLACNMSQEEVNDVIAREPQSLDEIVITCRNGLRDCVVGGPVSQVEKFGSLCRTMGRRIKVMDVPFAFHSPAMDPMMSHFGVACRSISLSNPKVPIASNVYGRLFKEEDLTNEYFSHHTRQPVSFLKCLQGLHSIGSLADQKPIFLEIGPHPITLPMIMSSFPSLDSRQCLPTLRKDQKNWTSLSQTLSTLFTEGTPIKWGRVFLDSSAELVALPDNFPQPDACLPSDLEPLVEFSSPGENLTWDYPLADSNLGGIEPLELAQPPSRALGNDVWTTTTQIAIEVAGWPSYQNIFESHTLRSLGIDSLRRIQLLFKLISAFQGECDIDHHAISECDTMGELHAVILQCLCDAQSTQSSSTKGHETPSSSPLSSISSLVTEESTCSPVLVCKHDNTI